jgi:predicted ATP-binding protein involved in virulence
VTNVKTPEAPTDALLRIDNLKLENYRCFSKCSLDFHPSLTVLVAENAQGKSTILEALSLALDPLVATLTESKSPGFARSDVRLSLADGEVMTPISPANFSVEGVIAGRPVTWSRSLGSVSTRSRSSTKELKSVADAAVGLKAASALDSAALLPVVAYYRTDRLWSSQASATHRGGERHSFMGRMSGYDNWSTPTSSFQLFMDWYRLAFNDLRSSTSKFRDANNRLEKHLAAIHDAVRTALEPTGWTSISLENQFDADGHGQAAPEFIAIGHNTKGRLPLELLSDGVKSMVSLVADLSYRCVRLNPQFGEEAARLTPGVVLIDEIDMHLHPRWQQVVVELLQRAFPRVQLIVTSHSPQVLSTVDYQSIRLVRLNDSSATVTKPEYQTRGIESADILARLMNVDPVPQIEEARWLSDYRALVQTAAHETVAGTDLWSRIVSHFGADSPVLAEIETLRRFQEFRVVHGISRQEGSGDAKA